MTARVVSTRVGWEAASPMVCLHFPRRLSQLLIHARLCQRDLQAAQRRLCCSIDVRNGCGQAVCLPNFPRLFDPTAVVVLADLLDKEGLRRHLPWRKGVVEAPLHLAHR